MFKLSTGSNRYLKAQLRPLTKPTFWASAGLFGVSIFALANLFQQPNAVLDSGDRDAIVNLDENESLTPEERARAADIDDLSVLLKDLDKTQTIDSVSSRLNEAQTTNLKAPEAIADLDNIKPTPQVAASSGQFTPLPPISITLANGANNSQINSPNSSSSGFIGFDPRSSGQVSITSPSASNREVTPLTTALERYSTSRATPDTAMGDPAISPDNALTPATTNNSLNTTAAAATGQRSGIPSNGVQPNGSPTYTMPVTVPSLASPASSPSQSLTPQNSSNNAYTQIFNPNLVIPSAPAIPQPAAPSLPFRPAIPGSTNLSEAQPSASIGTSTSTSFSQPAASPANAVFGAPSGGPVAAPTNSAISPPEISSPAPFSVPNSIPGQHSGNGRINTFANP